VLAEWFVGQFVAPEGRSVLAEWFVGQFVAPGGRSVLAEVVDGQVDDGGSDGAPVVEH